MTKYDYDLICIGSGSAGGAAAFVAKKANMRVAIIEEFKEKLGGNCPNYACVPTKALLHAAQIYKLVKKSQEFGIQLDNTRFDFAKIAKYRDEIVNQLTGRRIERNLHNAGIELLWGHARFASEHELEIEGRRYSAEHVIISTGSKEFFPPIQGLKETGFLVSDQLARATSLPESMIIIGGGPVGTEFAQALSSFGVKVTLLQREKQILPREDPEIAKAVQEQLEAQEGVRVVLNVEIVSFRKETNQKIVTVKLVGGDEEDLAAQEILVAAGRYSALEGLNLEAAGLKLNARGKIELNEYLQTTAQAHIWVAGDAAGNWQFTHTAAYEGDLVGRNICHRHDEVVDYRVVPRVTFCEPEVASVGMSEPEASKKGFAVVVAKFSIGNLGRALIEHDRRGIVKLVVEAKTMKILGGHILGLNAGQMIHEIALAMRANIPAPEIGRMIHAYPTWSEAVAAAAEQLLIR